MFTFSVETLADAQVRGMMRPPDRLLTRLLCHQRIADVLVADPFRSWPIQLAKRLAGRHQPSQLALLGVEEAQCLSPMRLRRRDPVGLSGVERAYRRYDRCLGAAAERRSMTRPAVVTFNPFVAGFSPLEWASSVTFYARDDWASFPPHRRWWPVYEAAYEAVRERRRRVCGVSQAIIDRIAPRGTSVVVPNGIEPAEWSDVRPPPSWFTALRGPRAVYAGTIDDRLDVEAVRGAVANLEGGSVVMVGPVADQAVAHALTNVTDVYLPGHRGRAELTTLISAADVCLVPHRRTPLTEAMSPLKLYEYLAAGRPVVATDLAPMRIGHPNVVLVDRNANFGDGVRRALELGSVSEDERRRFIAEHDWANRHDVVIDLMLRSDGTTDDG